MTSKASTKGDAAGHAAERKQAADDQRAFRNDAWRGRSLKGETPQAIADADGVSLATVRRGIKDATSRALDVAEAAGAADRATKAEARKAERKLAAVPDAASGSAPEAGPAKPEKAKAGNGERVAITLEEGQAFNEKWTEDDKATIAREYARLGAEKVLRPPSGVYLRVEDGAGKLVFSIEGSRLRFPLKGVVAPEGAVEKKDGFADLALSTSRKAG